MDIDFSLYVRAPRLDADACVVLGNRLALAAPRATTASQQRALGQMAIAVRELEEIQKERQRLRPESLLPFDQAFDAAWGALYARLSGTARLPASYSSDAPRAAELMETLFADGLRFLTFDFESEWVESKHRLERMVEENLEVDLVRIVGRDVLEAVRGAHNALGHALGLSSLKRTKVRGSLQDGINGFSKAMLAYTRALLGELNIDDAESLRGFRAAVAPIDELRIANRERTGNSAADENEEGEEDASTEAVTAESNAPVGAAMVPVGSPIAAQPVSA